MATEYPATDEAGRDWYQLKTLILAAATLCVVLLGVVLVVAHTNWLNQYWFLHFPLGFYLLAQGLLIFIVAICFWYVRVQERLDRARSENEGLR
jgi:putative solute:sodium symporter small subunit